MSFGLSLALQITLLVLGVILVVAVLMQHGKSYGLSGTISGGAETFFGKDKGKRIDKILSRATSIIGALFMIVALLTFTLQSADGYVPSRNVGNFVNVETQLENHTHE